MYSGASILGRRIEGYRSRSRSANGNKPLQYCGVQIVLSLVELSKKVISDRVFFVELTVSHPRTPSNLPEYAKEIRKSHNFIPFFHCKKIPAYYVDL